MMQNAADASIQNGGRLIVQLSERIFVSKNGGMAEICRRQVPVYNTALWVFRSQHFGWEHLDDRWKAYYGKVSKGKKGRPFVKKPGTWMVSYYDVRNMMRWLPIYRDAGSIAANTVQRVADAVKAHYRHVAEWVADGSNDTGEPKFPGYLRGDGVKTVAMFTYGQFSIRNGNITFGAKLLQNAGMPPIVPVHVPQGRLPDQKTGDRDVVQVRVVPSKHGGYWIECVHDVEPGDSEMSGTWWSDDPLPILRAIEGFRVMSIDLNLNRVCMLTFSDTVIDNKPIGFSGGPAKSVNQWYNKEMVRLQSERARHVPRLAELNRKHAADPKSLTDDEWKEWKALSKPTKLMNAITENRNQRIEAIFHRLSRAIVDIATGRGIDAIVIGHNKLQKQEIDLGDRTNQNFVQLPVFKMIGKLRYKCEMAGILLIEQSEEYTTQASFPDGDPLPTLEEQKANPVQFSGHRIDYDHRYKLYETGSGRVINGDVNDSYNIMKKAFPNAVNRNGIGGARLHPEIRALPAS